MLIKFNQHRAQVRGFSLIEILIALFVLAVGLLGFAGLQMMSLSSSQEGYLRSQATQLAENMAARMRGNRNFINGADVANPYLANSKGAAVAGLTRYCAVGTAAVTENNPSKNCSTGFCTGAEIAEFDRQAVCNELRSMGLPDGEIALRCADVNAADGDACSADSRYTIYVGWQPNLKTDRGERTLAVNGQCANEMGLTGTKSCIAVELAP